MHGFLRMLPRIKDGACCRPTITASTASGLDEFQHVGCVVIEFNHKYHLSNLGNVNTVVGGLVAYKEATFVSSEVPNKADAIRSGRAAVYDALFFEPFANRLCEGRCRGEDDSLFRFARKLFQNFAKLRRFAIAISGIVLKRFIAYVEAISGTMTNHLEGGHPRV